jgi:hypothetical protein
MLRMSMGPKLGATLLAYNKRTSMVMVGSCKEFSKKPVSLALRTAERAIQILG